MPAVLSANAHMFIRALSRAREGFDRRRSCNGQLWREMRATRKGMVEAGEPFLMDGNRGPLAVDFRVGAILAEVRKRRKQGRLSSQGPLSDGKSEGIASVLRVFGVAGGRKAE